MIENKTKKNILANKSKLCISPWCQGTGLMFSKKKEDFGLIFEFKKERTVSLHMFFVFYPIDVLFLNSEKKVVDKKENFKPFKFYNSKKKIKYVIELPISTIKEKNVSLEDIISF